MSQVTMEIPDDTLLALKLSKQDAGAALRMAAAMKLYELGQLSSGAAAHLAGVPRVVFLSRLADYGIDTFRLTEEDFRKETRLAKPLLEDHLELTEEDLKGKGLTAEEIALSPEIGAWAEKGEAQTGA